MANDVNPGSNSTLNKYASKYKQYGTRLHLHKSNVWWI